MSKKPPFMAVPGSDPNAAMKGDHVQHTQGSTAPHTKPQKPQKIGGRGYAGVNQYALPKRIKGQP
jgi:hypothetical protein